MSRLTWGAAATRYYETGVDRGVLYVGSDPGVAWNGLISVDESPSGAEPKPAYLDGIKFRNISSSEEFEATISAFSSPQEFGVCVGNASIQNGLIATQQPRKKFGLSYRTLVGNPLVGTDLGYKIHLIYNALAGPSSRSSNTVADSAEPIAYSWPVTTLPPALAGYKPTSHYIIDTRYAAPEDVTALEDIIYGDPSFAPRLPTPTELVALFA